jgi:preprotein translocase subunit YajC
MGIIAAAEAASKSSSSSLTFPILIVLVFVGFYFLMIRPQRRRQQQVAQQQKTINPGARVRTTAGMYATVVAVDGDDVVLEVAPNVEVRYLKRAIMEVIASGEGDTGEGFEDHESEDSTSFTDSYDETTGTHTTADGVGSGDGDHADSHDDQLAKSDKDNVF